jgi:hypothetical protein
MKKREVTIQGKTYTRSEAAEILGVTRERIRQLDRLGLLDLRLNKTIGPLKPWGHKKLSKAQYEEVVEKLPEHPLVKMVEKLGGYDAALKAAKEDNQEKICPSKSPKTSRSSVPKTGTIWRSSTSSVSRTK